jgi:hypothetical protein
MMPLVHMLGRIRIERLVLFLGHALLEFEPFFFRICLISAIAITGKYFEKRK